MNIDDLNSELKNFQNGYKSKTQLYAVYENEWTHSSPQDNPFKDLPPELLKKTVK